MNMKLTAKLLAPYFAVGVFWCVFSNAWLAMLAYHAQILLWSGKAAFRWKRPQYTHMVFLALPAALAGPLLFVLLPYITHEPLSLWLAHHHFSRVSLLLLIPYFGLLHPCLEQLHWAPLRKYGLVSHLAFAGYHMVVLYTLLTGPWLIACFGVLVTVSILWQQVATRTHSLAVPVVSHILADLGVAIVAYLTF
jgi:hypothetical protein